VSEVGAMFAKVEGLDDECGMCDNCNFSVFFGAGEGDRNGGGDSFDTSIIEIKVLSSFRFLYG
jgi:hypothetical protein